jgi:hypothetical protein
MRSSNQQNRNMNSLMDGFSDNYNNKQRQPQQHQRQHQRMNSGSKQRKLSLSRDNMMTKRVQPGNCLFYFLIEA